jgi:hypothetical protein
MREVVKLQQTQSQVFTTLLQAWTTPAPPPKEYISPEDRDILSQLQDAAKQGDEDAALILSDPRARHEYFEAFR